MAEKEQEKSPQEKHSPQSSGRISDGDRMRYIGFEVFTGKPKELFKSEAEKQNLVEKVRAKRAKDEHLREDCTLLDERVSMLEKIVLTVSSLVVLAAFFLPWYSVYSEVPIVVEPEQQVMTAPDSLAMAGGTADSMAAMASDSGMAMVDEAGDIAAEVADAEAAAEAQAQADRGLVTHEGSSSQEEIITGHITRKRTTKNYSHLTGFGSVLALGSVGSYVFSSGLILVLTAVLLLLFTLSCIFVPLYNLYGIYGQKGNPDEMALKLKKMLRLNWLPLVLFVAVLFLSFFGADYGFDPAETYTSIGESYGPAVFLGTLSYGVFVAIAVSIIAAVKGIEI